MEVAQNRPPNRYRGTFYRDDDPVSDSVKPHQPLIQSNLWRVTQRDKISNCPDRQNGRSHHDSAKPQSSFAQSRSIDRSLSPPIKRIGAETGTHNGANRSA